MIDSQPRAHSPKRVWYSIGITAVLLFVIFCVLQPVLAGFHLGYNAATDHECISRVFQWCH